MMNDGADEVLLPVLADVSGREPADVRGALGLARRAHGELSVSNWTSVLDASAGVLRLSTHRVWLSAAEVVAAASSYAPLVTLASTGEAGAGRLVAVTRRRRSRVWVQGHGWLTEKELAAVLGDASGRLHWVVIEARLSQPPITESVHHEAHHAPGERLMRLVRPDRSEVWAIVLYGVVTGALTLAIPVAVQLLVNTVAFGGLLQPVVILALLLLAALGFSALLTGVQAFATELIQRRLFVRVVDELSYRLSRVRVEVLERQHGPELVNRFFDVVTVQKQGATLLLDGIGVFLQTFVGLLVLSFYHPMMLAFSIVLLAGMAFVVLGLGRNAVGTAINESVEKYKVGEWLEEIARNPIVFRSASGRTLASARAADLTAGYVLARRAHYRLVLRQLVGALGLQVVASSALLFLGGTLVIMGQLTLGQLVASELIVTAIVAGFSKLGKHLEGVYDLLAAVDKLGVLLDLPLEGVSGDEPKHADGPVAVGWSGRYGRISVEPAERIDVRAETNSAAAALLETVAGFRANDADVVHFDGGDLRDVRVEAVHDVIGVLRSIEIFEGTVFDNVAAGHPDLGVGDVRRALDTVGLLGVVEALPEGVSTRLTATGFPLNLEDHQRLMVARVLVRDPRLVVVADPIAGALPEMPEAFDAVFGERCHTVLCATAREEVRARCDRTVDVSTGHSSAANEMERDEQ